MTKKVKTRGTSLQALCAAVTSLLLGLFTMTGQPVYIFALFLFTPIALLQPVYMIPVFYVSSLSSQYFVVEEGIGVVRVLALAIIIGVFFRILTGQEKKIDAKWILSLSYIMLTTFASFIFANEQFPQILFVVAMNILIVLSISNIKLDAEQINQLFSSLFISIVIISISIFIRYILNPIEFEGRMTLNEDLNSNTLATVLAQLAAFLFGYLLYNPAAKTICLIFGFIHVYLVWLTGSRSALLAIIFGVFVTLIIFKQQTKQAVGRMVLLGIIGVLGYLLISMFAIQESILGDRFSYENIIASGGTNRWERVVAELKYVIPDNILLGVGPSALNETIALQEYIAYPGSSHNILISMLSQIGVLGSLGYFVFVFGILRQIIKKIEINFYLCVPLCLILTCIINGIGEVVYHERFFWSALALGALCIGSCNNKM